MSINTKSATAIVRFTGLGILCFNPRQKRAENLFIHDAGHKLAVKIYKPLTTAENDEFNAEGEKDRADYQQFSGYWHQRTAYYENLDVSQLTSTFDRVRLSIDVSGIGNPAVDGYSLYQPDTFSRKDSGEEVDYRDFRWMVNAQRDGIFGDGTLTPIANSTVPTSKLFISNAEIYTASIAKEIKFDEDEEPLPQEDMIFKKVANVAESAAASAKIAALDGASDFGKIAADIGAAINADQVQVKITVGDEEHVHILPRIHRPYIVSIENNAELAASDLPIYQTFWAPTGDQTFDLLTSAEIARKKAKLNEPIGARTMCNGIYTEEPETIEPFIGDGPED